jgi:hypothetical protein
MLKRKVSCTFKREKISLDNQERIYLLYKLKRSPARGEQTSAAFHVGGQKNMFRVTQLGGRTLEVVAILLAWVGLSQATCNAQTFALSDTRDLALLNVKGRPRRIPGA